MKTRNYLALDLGATSGRAMVGSFDGECLEVREVHRFQNAPVPTPDGLRWDLPGILAECETALGIAARRHPGICSVACDSWGVDHGFIAADGSPLALPFSYQDSRTQEMLAEINSVLPLDDLFRLTGTAVVPITTLFQLVATKRSHPDLLARATRFLFMTDLVHQHLGGEASAEHTMASTSSLFACDREDWCDEVLSRFELPRAIFPPVVAAGSALGSLRREIALGAGLGDCRIIAPGCHDTASALIGAPVESDEDLVVSSGTWSMLGLVVPKPVSAHECVGLGCGNYRIPGRRWALLRGIMGLWLFDRFRREDGIEDAATLCQLALGGRAFAVVFDPGNPVFQGGESLRSVMGEWCRRTGQEMPDDCGTIARAILESLALYYRESVSQLSRLAGRAVRRLVIVGGGTKNAVMSQFTADATGLPVVIGSMEAAAAGNLLVQAVAMGDLAGFDDIRAVACRSHEPPTLDPCGLANWDEAWGRFLSARVAYGA